MLPLCSRRANVRLARSQMGLTVKTRFCILIRNKDCQVLVRFLADSCCAVFGGVMRILLVEDHKRLSQSIVEGLCNFGFGVDSFFTAEEGVGAVKSLAYD